MTTQPINTDAADSDPAPACRERGQARLLLKPDVGVVTTSWLLVTVSARWVWARLVESLPTDTARAILDTITSIGPPPASGGPDLGGQW